MRVLITGASGFLGSHLYKAMSLTGHDMRFVTRNTSHIANLEGVGGIRVTGDVTDRACMEQAVRGCDWVIHAAADLNYWRQNPRRQWGTNLEGTRNVARACRTSGVSKFVYVSSTGAIGIPEEPRPADENFHFNLAGSGLDYHLSKHRAEEAVMEEFSKGLHAIIVNPASITGASRMTRLFGSVRRSPIVPCFSGGNCVVHVDDVVQGIVSAIGRGRAGERYILGGDNLTFVEMARKAARTMHLSRSFIKIPRMFTGAAAAFCEPYARWRNRAPKFAYMVHYCANRFMYYESAKAKSELNYQARSFDAILSSFAGREPVSSASSAAAGKAS